MYRLSFNIGDRAGTFEGESSDETFDRLCTLMCNDHDDCSFANEVTDLRFRNNGGIVTFERYEKAGDIVNFYGKKIGHYTNRMV